jgi:hypothetical protein
MSTAKVTKALDSILLHNEDCFSLLLRAQAKTAEDHGAIEESPSSSFDPPTRTNPFAFYDSDGSGDENAKEESDSDASSSSQEGKEASDAPPTDGHPQQHHTPLPPYTKPKQKPKDQKQRQHEQQVKSHTMNLNRISIMYDDKMAIHLPIALLQRQQQQHPSVIYKCQAFRELAESIGCQHQKKPVIVMLLRSGRFAAAVFSGGKCVKHTSSQRYTVRKGQGKAQSAQDGNRRPKSIGSQLRRAGEQSLKEDIRTTIGDWKDFFQQAGLFLLSCPKTMKSTVFAPELDSILPRNDPRLRNIPFDVGRPTFEGACIVYEAIMTVLIGESTQRSCEPSEDTADEPRQTEDPPKPTTLAREVSKDSVAPEVIPLTKLHETARDGNLPSLLDLLRDIPDNLVNQPAGYDFMTVLHFAAESTSKVDPVTSAACVSALLIQGHADPTKVDARLRLPYFLASHEKTREAFRKARALLGEEYCDWDEAKVGSPLTEDDINLKKEKEAEKNRRKKAKQKEKKAKEKAQTEEMEKRRKEQDMKERLEEDAKRARDALPSKSVRAENICDFCQIECKGRKRLQMFKRLDYNYCSSDCVQKHKRELMAKAAMERFN